MQQLSGVDASFLHMETDTTFGHVCGVVLLDRQTPSGRLTTADVERLVAERLPLMPPLRRRLVEVPFGSYDEVLMTRDWTPLEPDVLEHKFYAKGIGPVLELGLSGGVGREELIRFTRG